ncbi:MULTISPECIES: YpiF family protein [unclassified Virgibacillus]|uniref:YpiF family protein n=1 Tax=unclassified Virgibacillus TaxID=2620237 RepID=UPI0024DE9E6C|nr:YpiF family protein [Virgibacillus sp. LDC-1]
MKWKKADVEKYVQAKEYIDTILLPLIPFQFSQDKDIELVASQNDLLHIFASEIEKELAGRVMLLPSYHYISSAAKSEEYLRLNSWIQETEKQPFEHAILLTFDASWKKYEKEITGNLIWLPMIQSESFDSKQIKGLIKNQVEQICEMIRAYWQ